MAKIKLTKTTAETAQPQAQGVELRDTVVPGFLCKIAPAGRKVFMLQTVAMFMHYVHTEDDPVRKAAELAANLRKMITDASSPKEVAA